MEASTSPSQSNADDSTNKKQDEQNLIDKKTSKQFTTDDDIQSINSEPTKNKPDGNLIDEKSIKSITSDGEVLPKLHDTTSQPFSTVNTPEKKSSHPFRYCTPDCKGAHKKIIAEKSEKKTRSLEREMRFHLDGVPRGEKYSEGGSVTDVSEVDNLDIDSIANIVENDDTVYGKTGITGINSLLDSLDRDDVITVTGTPDNSSTETDTIREDLDSEEEKLDIAACFDIFEEQFYGDKVHIPDTAELRRIEINRLLDSFDRSDNNYEEEISITEMLAASVIQNSKDKKREKEPREREPK